MHAEHVIVGLSGGVDSAVAALALIERGFRVEGLFMRNWDDPDDPGHCPADHDLEAAREVASHLGIPLHLADFTAEYWHRVFEHFLAEQAAGRTPNPDVLCNREIKFRAFLEHALGLGADSIATGHYARVLEREDGARQLARGLDRGKDQSYFLHDIDRSALGRVRFPLGELHKEEVRARARAAGLPNHDRPDSTGICFIGERSFGRFLEAYLSPRPGPMRTPDGRELGIHRGLMYYTIGQRHGLGIGGGSGEPGKPWYVLAKDTEANCLYVGQGNDHPWLFSEGLLAAAPRWLLPAAPPLPARLAAQVRYRQSAVACEVAPAAGGGLRVRFDTPVRAVTPGQALVLYDGDTCLGGAVITGTLPDRLAGAAAVPAASAG
jgi:tRNA-specific 2-thiouridylase